MKYEYRGSMVKSEGLLSYPCYECGSRMIGAYFTTCGELICYDCYRLDKDSKLTNGFSLFLGNYYGTVEAKRAGEKCYLSLDNWDGSRRVEISKSLYYAIKKEFDQPNRDDSCVEDIPPSEEDL